MDRRKFLAASMASSALAVAGKSAAESPASGAREYYQLRRYSLLSGPQTKLTESFFADALIPALSRLGLGPVGAFRLEIGPDTPATYLLIPGRRPVLEFNRRRSRISARGYRPAERLYRLAQRHSPRRSRYQRQAHLPATYLREPQQWRSCAQGGDVPFGRIRDFPERWISSRILRGYPPRLASAQPDVHAQLYRSGRTRRKMECLPQRSRMEEALYESAIQLRPACYQYHQPDPEPAGLFPDLKSKATG